MIFIFMTVAEIFTKNNDTQLNHYSALIECIKDNQEINKWVLHYTAWFYAIVYTNMFKWITVKRTYF